MDVAPPPADPDSLSTSLRRNIGALEGRRRKEEASATRQEQLAATITRFTGSMAFVYLHLALFGGWIVANVGGLPGVKPFDPSFVVLSMVASVEAIFLSTFVLISQNRMSAAEARRADLDLQISLLTEHELTKLADLVSHIADRLDVPHAADTEIAEIRKHVAPEAVLDAIEAERRGT